MTVQDLVNNILNTLGAIASGETPNVDDSNLTLTFANALISSWNAAIAKSLAATYDPVLYTFVPVAQFTSLVQVITLPNGWFRALTFNTCLDLALPFGKSPLPDALVQLAAQSKAEIITPQNTGPTS